MIPLSFPYTPVFRISEWPLVLLILFGFCPATYGIRNSLNVSLPFMSVFLMPGLFFLHAIDLFFFLLLVAMLVLVQRIPRSGSLQSRLPLLSLP